MKKEHKINLVSQEYLFDQAINKNINIADYYDLDGKKLRQLLEKDGYKVIRNYDTGRSGKVVLANGFIISTNGYMYKHYNMKILTEKEIESIIGVSIAGYIIECARVIISDTIESNYYGVALGKNKAGKYVTWEFYFEEEKPQFQWSSYFEYDCNAAFHNYNMK